MLARVERRNEVVGSSQNMIVFATRGGHDCVCDVGGKQDGGKRSVWARS